MNPKTIIRLILCLLTISFSTVSISQSVNQGNELALAPVTRTFYSVASGLSSGAVWSENPVGPPIVMPGNGGNHNYVIQTGFTIQNDKSAWQVNHIEIQTGATFDMLSNNRITLLGNWMNDGTFTHGTSKIVFSGFTIQNITGSSVNRFYHLESNSGIHTQVAGAGTEVVYLLSIPSGMFKTNGLLTLLSDVNGTASIGPLTGGTLSGDVTYQRYHNALQQDWVMLGSPIQNQKINDLNDDVITTGFTGSDYPSYNFNNVLWHGESVLGGDDEGFVGATSTANPLLPGRGYFVFMTNGAVTVDFTGPINIGNQNFGVTYTSSGIPANDGWNLISNPFPCTIDWSSPSGWTKSKVNNAVHIYDAALGVYATYINGISNNGGSRYIASGQAFWVQATNQFATLQANESVKTLTPAAFKSDEDENVLRFSVSNGPYVDQTTITLNDEATFDFEEEYDATKLIASESVPAIFTKSADDIQLAINAVPMATESFEIPLFVEALEAIELTLLPFGQHAFSAGSCLTLTDLKTLEEYNLLDMESLPFTHDPEFQGPRFLLSVGAHPLISQEDVLCFEMSNGSLELHGIGNGPWSYVIENSSGELVINASDEGETYTAEGLESGMYTITLGGSGLCTSTSFDVIVTQPMPMNVVATTEPPTCPSSENGSIHVEVAGGVAPYSFEWSNGGNTADLENLSAGEYYLVVTDTNGCSFEKNYTLLSLSNLTVAFETSADSYPLINGLAVVNFQNTSQDGANYQWEFGDETLPEQSENATHAYTQAGMMVVSLSANDGICSDVFTKEIEIIGAATDLDENNMASQVNAWLSDEGINITLKFDRQQNIMIRAFNQLGQLINEPLTGNYQQAQLLIPLPVRGAIVEITNLETQKRTLIQVVY
jgi:hypothetical protein